MREIGEEEKIKTNGSTCISSSLFLIEKIRHEIIKIKYYVLDKHVSVCVLAISYVVCENTKKNSLYIKNFCIFARIDYSL